MRMCTLDSMDEESATRSNSQRQVAQKLEFKQDGYQQNAQQQVTQKLDFRRDGYQQHAQQQLNRYHQTVLSDMALPGFRFHPTEEELVGYYLRRMVEGRRNSVELIASLDLYQHDPWELPAMALMGEKEWFFFCPRDKKYPNGARPNRVTATGYWKATGTDRAVRCNADFRCCVGLKKTLVFYTGRAPRGNKTDWIMNEYRLPKLFDKADSAIFESSPYKWRSSMTSASDHGDYVIENDVALCRIYRKSNSATGAAIRATKLHSQSVLSKLSCSNHSIPRPQNQALQQVTLPLRPDDSRLGSTVSTAFTRGSDEEALQKPATAPLETAISRIIGGSSSSLTLASSYPLIMSCPVSGSFPVLRCSSSSGPRHQEPQVLALPTTSDNLRSSHALMAKLLMEETCYSNSRIDSSSSGLALPTEKHGNITQRIHADDLRRKSESEDLPRLPFTSQMGRILIGSHCADHNDLTFQSRG